MKNFFSYLSLIAMTIYMEVMFDGFEGVKILAFEILLLIVLFFLAWHLKRNIQMGISIPIPAVQKGKEIQIEIYADNRGILPVTKCWFQLNTENQAYGHKNKEKLQMFIPGRHKKQLFFYATGQYCGRVSVSLTKVKIWDYLGIFSRKVPDSHKQYVNVLPEFYELETIVSERTRNFSDDGEEYDLYQSGDDPSEVIGVREFRDGDSLQRIHWKISAKSEGWMIREFGKPVSTSVCLRVDLYEQEKVTMERMDTLIELLAAVSYSLWKENIPYCVVWFDIKRGEMIRKRISKEEHVYELLDEFLGATPYNEVYDLVALYQKEYPGETFQTELDMNTLLDFSINGECVHRFQQKNLKEQLAEYRLEV